MHAEHLSACPLVYNIREEHAMLPKALVLGAGRVGAAIARDLLSDFNVSVADCDKTALFKVSADNPEIRPICADAGDTKTIKDLAREVDIVISAVPSALGFKTLEAVIGAGTNVVDISFFSEDPFLLDARARNHNVTAVPDCGIAPGMSNMIAGYTASLLDKTESFECFVGGLPRKRKPPFQYKAPFSPDDVMEEYTRPARIKWEGLLLTLPALSEREYVDFPEVGTLEAFYTDGLRTLLETLDIPTMKEKTLRYPGHAALIETLRDIGFLGKRKIRIGEQYVSPYELSMALILPHWRFDDDEEDILVMRTVTKGAKDEMRRTISYSLFASRDPVTKTSAMARTTGYTATAVARLIAKGVYRRKGVCPPEHIGADEGCFEQVLALLKERGIVFAPTCREDDAQGGIATKSPASF